jgi:NAD(P)-dependent dehydrogenase (short-subunit alcohol dehydrogenase family)
MKACLVFGGNGAIGSAITELFKSLGYSVWTTTRAVGSAEQHQVKIIGDRTADSATLKGLPLFDVVVWAQGVNQNDSILDVDVERLSQVIEANTIFVVTTMNMLLSNGSLKEGSHLCVISSIWEEITRGNKLSYSISKAAIGALVRSAAIDLSSRGIYVNAVLPGVLDTPMTRSVLSQDQLNNVEGATGFNRLVSPHEIAKVVEFLCSESNSGISGQSIVVDLGFSHAKQI